MPHRGASSTPRAAPCLVALAASTVLLLPARVLSAPHHPRPGTPARVHSAGDAGAAESQQRSLEAMRGRGRGRNTACVGGAGHTPARHLALYGTAALSCGALVEGHTGSARGRAQGRLHAPTCRWARANDGRTGHSQHGDTGTANRDGREERAGRASDPSDLVLSLRNGSKFTNITVSGAETAMVIIDMWSYHPCKTVANRAAALVPRLNAVAAAVRRAGGVVIFSPTDAAEAYVGWPQREKIFALPRATPVETNASLPPLPNAVWGRADECGQSGYGCVWNYGEARMNPAIAIDDGDYIVGGATNPEDVYSVLKHHGVKHVIHAGIAENICVQAKCEGIPTLTKLGFHCYLSRDLTDAQSHYEPETFRPAPGAWVSPDWGTRNVTAAIERNGIALTLEAAQLAVDAGVWPTAAPVDPVLHLPWGTALRPHLFDGSALVTLSTWCGVEATVGCAEPFAIRYTVDGTAPTPISQVFAAPFAVDAPGTTMVRAAGFRLSDGAPTHAESTSVLVRREFASPDGAAPEGVVLPLPDAPVLWNFGDDPDYRVYPTVNMSWLELPLSMRGRTYAAGLGLRAPQHLNFNLSDIRAAMAPRPLTAFVAAAGIDSGCDVGGAGNAGHEKPDPSVPTIGSANCHDIAEWQRAALRVYVDGELAHESPVLQAETLAWNVAVALPPDASVLRVVALPVGDDGQVPSAAAQNAYDWVDLVGGFK